MATISTTSTRALYDMCYRLDGRDASVQTKNGSIVTGKLFTEGRFKGGPGLQVIWPGTTGGATAIPWDQIHSIQILES